MAENAGAGKFELKMGTPPPNFRYTVPNIQEDAEYGSRTKDKVIVNNKDGKGPSFRLNKDHASIVASQEAEQKIVGQHIISKSWEEKHTTNRLSIEADDILWNGHKLNPDLHEYSDFKQFTDPYGGIHQVGGFSMFGTVLVKAWDHQLNKYVLIRRLARMPMFSPKVNVPEIPETLGIIDSTKIANRYKVKQTTSSVEEWQKNIKGILQGNNGGSNVSGGYNNADMQSAAEYADSRVGDTGYGNNGCTAWVQDFLSHAGHPLAQLMQDGSQGNLMWVPNLMEWAKANGLWKEASEGGALGDVCILETNYNTGDGPDHVVIATGTGEYWGNSSSRNQIVRDSIAGDYGSENVWGYIATGSGAGYEVNGGCTRSTEEIIGDAGSTSQ